MERAAPHEGAVDEQANRASAGWLRGVWACARRLPSGSGILEAMLEVPVGHGASGQREMMAGHSGDMRVDPRHRMPVGLVQMPRIAGSPQSEHQSDPLRPVNGQSCFADLAVPPIAEITTVPAACPLADSTNWVKVASSSARPAKCPTPGWQFPRHN
jgi:hypothetical protein